MMKYEILHSITGTVDTALNTWWLRTSKEVFQYQNKTPNFRALLIIIPYILVTRSNVTSGTNHIWPNYTPCCDRLTLNFKYPRKHIRRIRHLPFAGCPNRGHILQIFRCSWRISTASRTEVTFARPHTPTTCLVWRKIGVFSWIWIRQALANRLPENGTLKVVFLPSVRWLNYLFYCYSILGPLAIAK